MHCIMSVGSASLVGVGFVVKRLCVVLSGISGHAFRDAKIAAIWVTVNPLTGSRHLGAISAAGRRTKGRSRIMACGIVSGGLSAAWEPSLPRRMARWGTPFDAVWRGL